jgi:hypothetical protein
MSLKVIGSQNTLWKTSQHIMFQGIKQSLGNPKEDQDARARLQIALFLAASIGNEELVDMLLTNFDFCDPYVRCIVLCPGQYMVHWESGIGCEMVLFPQRSYGYNQMGIHNTPCGMAEEGKHIHVVELMRKKRPQIKTICST